MKAMAATSRKTMHSADAISGTKGRLNISGFGPRFGSTKLAAAMTCGAFTLAVLSALLLIAVRPALAQTESVLHSFAQNGTDGYNPYAGLAIDTAGNLYGTTNVGGASSAGTVFKVTPSGTETVLYSFKGGTDGCNPFDAGVVLGKKGVLYGATSGCGANAVGTVFKLTRTGAETVLHSFAFDGKDGFNPYAGLVLDKTTGNLYGTTYYGGASAAGTVFEITPTGAETVLYSFANDGKDGKNPYAGLVLDKTGNLYGTTNLGGANGL